MPDIDTTKEPNPEIAEPILRYPRRPNMSRRAGGVLLPLLLVVTGLGGRVAVAGTQEAGGGVKKDGRPPITRDSSTHGASTKRPKRADKFDRFTYNGCNVQLLGQRTPAIEKLVDLMTKRMAIAHHHELAVAVVNDDKLVASILVSVPSAGTVEVGRPWCIGSTTKALADMALLPFVEDGRISLDTPVVPFLGLTPLWPKDGREHVMDEAWNRARLCDLMNHGIVSDDEPMFERLKTALGKPLQQASDFEVTRCVLSARLLAEPGRQTKYGGWGLGLAGPLLERLGGARTDVVMNRFFEEKCGVKDAFCPAYPDQRTRFDQSLYGYSYDENTGQFRLNSVGDTPPWIGCGVCTGAWWMSVESLARIGSAITRGDVFKNPQRMFDLMLRTRSSDGGFACGWNCPTDPRGGVYLLKDGVVDGFNSTLWLGYGSSRSAIAVCGDCGASTNEICYFVGDLDRAGAFAGLPDQWENVNSPNN